MNDDNDEDEGVDKVTGEETDVNETRERFDGLNASYGLKRKRTFIYI